MPTMTPSASVARSSAPVARSKAKLIFFAGFLAATAFVTYMKNAQALDPHSEIAQHYAPAKGFLIAHAGFGMLAMLLGVFQFSNRLRARYTAAHRLLGYVYVVSVFIAGPLAFPVAVRTGTPSLVAASTFQSFGWMLTTAVGLYCIKLGNMTQHRRWMIRSYPFAMVFTVTRLIIPLPPVMKMGVPGIEIVVWSTIALAALLPNLFLEWRAIAPKRAAAA